MTGVQRVLFRSSVIVEPQWAVRQGDWKLISNPVGNHLAEDERNLKKLYLFNIKNDPSEKKNEVDKNPVIVSSLFEKYLNWSKDVESLNPQRKVDR